MEKSNVLKDNRYITWSTYNENSITDYEIFDEFETFIKQNFDTFNYFDSIRDNIYPGDYFREKDSIHLSSVGSVYRINRWIDQIPLQ